MKEKEKKIQAWLDFLQADLDTVPLDKKVSLLYAIFEDVLFNRPPFPLESPDSHESVRSLAQMQEVLKMTKDTKWEKFLLREVEQSGWRDLQTETKKYLEEILSADRKLLGLTQIFEYLIEKPSGVFRKGTIPKEFKKAGIPILRDLLDGIPKSAFKRCPECEKWFFHSSKRKKEFCSNRCASRHLTRKERTKSEKAKKEYRDKMKVYMKNRREEKSNPTNGNKNESEIFRCPYNDEDMTLEDCQWHQSECPFYDCPTCPHSTKKGG